MRRPVVVRTGMRPLGAAMVGAAVATHHVNRREAQAQEREMTQAQIAQANAQAEAAQAEAAAAHAEAQKASAAAAQPAPQQPAPMQYPQQAPPVQYVQQPPPPPPVQYSQVPQQQYANTPYVSDPNALHNKPPVPNVPPPLVAPMTLEVTSPHIVDENDPIMRQNNVISVPAGAVVTLHRGTLENGLGGPYRDYIEVDYQGKIGKISRFVVKRAEAAIPPAIPGAIPAAIASYTPA